MALFLGKHSLRTTGADQLEFELSYQLAFSLALRFTEFRLRYGTFCHGLSEFTGVPGSFRSPVPGAPRPDLHARPHVSKAGHGVLVRSHQTLQLPNGSRTLPVVAKDSDFGDPGP